MEPESTLPDFQVPANCPYPEPARSSPYPHIPLPEDLNIILPSTFGSPKWSTFPRVSPSKPCIHLSSHPICATCPAHLILLDLITRKTVGEQYRPLSSSLCSFLNSPVTSSFSSPNTPLNTPLSTTLGVCSSLSVSDQVSHPNKTINKLTVLYLNLQVFGYQTATQNILYRMTARIA